MAATASSVQSIFATKVRRSVGSSSRRDLVLASSLSFPLYQQRNGGVANSLRVVRCMAEEKPSELPKTVASSSTPAPSVQTPPPSAQTPPPSPPPPRVPKMSTKFTDVLAFSGPAPERINGRLAMIGFVAAIGAELAQGTDVVAQLGNGGLSWFVVTSVLFTFASLIPLFKGVSVESKSNGVMTSNAELWNGRFAMLGLVALVFTEFVKGGALV